MNRPCLILFGPPGSGKGTQAQRLRDALKAAHISTGDMLRERVASGDAVGREVVGIMQSGGLVPDETVNRMVQDRIAQPDCAGGFILDGYPRTVNQARLLVEMLKASQLRPVIVFLKVDYNEIVTRLAGRRQCPTCGAVYNVASNSVAGPDVCGKDGSSLVMRADDREEVVLERLKAYDQQSAPVLEFFKTEGYPCWELNGGVAPAEISQQILNLVQKYYGQPVAGPRSKTA